MISSRLCYMWLHGAMSVLFQLLGTHASETGDLVVGPQSHRDFITEGIGSVVLSYMGQDIRDQANGGSPCS